MLLPILLGCLAACADESPVDRADFRAFGSVFERDTGDGWRRFFAHGVNLSVGKPGTFPGELAATRDDYTRWLVEIAAMNANVVRLYTLHHPRFYEAFRDYNLDHPDRPVYLVQGIWLDELEHGDYMTDATAQAHEEIGLVVDAVYGCADIAHRFGKAYGRFSADVSPWLMAWLPGHEMDGSIVKLSQAKWASFTEYDGRYITRTGGQPIEAWVARNLDDLVTHETVGYGHQHPVGWSNWPALDPIHHPTETASFGQDLVDVNLAKFDRKPGFSAGLFASYHVYPFNPEFIIYDPQYVATKDRNGQLNSYQGYLLDLVKAHADVPVFVTEFGVPSSIGVAHMNDHGWHHGGYTEAQQAKANIAQYHAIVDAGAAGAVVFEWLDEWFKRTWMTNPTMLPKDRGPLWFDVLSPEESFGIKSFYPVPGRSIAVDGDLSDWPASAVVVWQGKSATNTGAFVRRLRVTSDPAFLFIALELNGMGDPLSTDKNSVTGPILIGLSTVDGDTGARRWPFGLYDSSPNKPIELAADHGLESVIVLDPAKGDFRVLTQASYDPTPRLNGEGSAGGLPISELSGEFQIARWLINNDAQYIAAGSKVDVQRRYFEPGKLTVGDTKTLTTAHIMSSDGVIELRIPWQALWVTDPSSRQVLFDDTKTADFDTRTTAGVRVMACATTWTGEVLRRGTASTPMQDVPLYAWPTWDMPSAAGERQKPLYDALRSEWADALPEPKL